MGHANAIRVAPDGYLVTADPRSEGSAEGPERGVALPPGSLANM
jgi:hypothetical protein